jgi:ComF family protein
MRLREELSTLREALSDLLFPPRCAFCDDDSKDVSRCSFCEECLGSLRPIEPPICERCGMPVPSLMEPSAKFCGRCLSDPPPYTRARYGVQYEGALRDALLRFKFGGHLSVGRALSELLLETFEKHFASSDFDIIVPIPMYDRRLPSRGFNQAVILAEGVESGTGIPLDRFSFRKIKDTPPQVGLTRRERVANLKRSFSVSKPDRIRGRRILLIDDVATTGSTIEEASRTLLKAGAGRVEALVLALRMPGHQDSPPEGALHSHT